MDRTLADELEKLLPLKAIPLDHAVHLVGWSVLEQLDYMRCVEVRIIAKNDESVQLDWFSPVLQPSKKVTWATLDHASAFEAEKLRLEIRVSDWGRSALSTHYAKVNSEAQPGYERWDSESPAPVRNLHEALGRLTNGYRRVIERCQAVEKRFERVRSNAFVPSIPALFLPEQITERRSLELFINDMLAITTSSSKLACRDLLRCQFEVRRTRQLNDHALVCLRAFNILMNGENHSVFNSDWAFSVSRTLNQFGKWFHREMSNDLPEDHPDFFSSVSDALATAEQQLHKKMSDLLCLKHLGAFDLGRKSSQPGRSAEGLPNQHESSSSKPRKNRTQEEKLVDDVRIAMHLQANPDCTRDDTATQLGITRYKVSKSSAWEEHQNRKRLAKAASRARGLGGIGDPRIDYAYRQS
ncbi:MAG: hypothetical protein H6815_10415 [Phycisphaeraceae bacterium]|nr:hypothetical protein [Phycisphaerales bacterium]MCB9860851.1 hypothetical protein [Phycisphaeraceae bacterium]